MASEDAYRRWRRSRSAAPPAGPSPGAVLRCYDPEFAAGMRVSVEQAEDRAALTAAMNGLDEGARSLAEGLRVAVSPGEPVPDRFRSTIEEHGGPLWQAAVILPRVRPSSGVTIDPRYYAGSCRLNPALGPVSEVGAAHLAPDGRPHAPPSDPRWDAVLVGVALEADPVRLTQDGRPRVDDVRRMFDRLGGDASRWDVALRVGRSIGLVRSAAGALRGFPDAKPRAVTDPGALASSGDVALAMGALLRLAGDHWTDLRDIVGSLGARCPAVLAEPSGAWEAREAVWFAEAADLLHRLGRLHARRDDKGVVAFRSPVASGYGEKGVLLTPDRDILVAPWSLTSEQYGRLARLAPYVAGDVVHRHHLTRGGAAADLTAGHADAVAFLAEHSRTGVPGNVATGLQQWVRAAGRVTILSGVTLLEEGGVLRQVDDADPDLPTHDYARSPGGRFTVDGLVVHVAFGEDPLTLRALLDRLGPRLPPDARGWRWQLAPQPTDSPAGLIAALGVFGPEEGLVPGAVRAAIHAAAGDRRCELVPAVMLSMPLSAAQALREDVEIGPILIRSVSDHEVVVPASEVPRVGARLAALGFETVGFGADAPASADPSVADSPEPETEG